jgi:undecaprenyl-diphosphatase
MPRPSRTTPKLWIPIAIITIGALTVTTASHGTTGVLTWWQAVVLGTIEGVTEYLPISSTGHLLVASRLLGLPQEPGSPGLTAVNTYVIAIQFGAILAVAVVLRNRLAELVRGIGGRSAAGRRLLISLAIAFVPSAVLGLVFDAQIESWLFGPWPVVAAWAMGGAAILALDASGRLQRRDTGGHDKAAEPNCALSISYGQAAIIGAAQCIALWPGTSRSLVTILAALLMGISMYSAVEFSFLLGLATLSAATGYKLLSDGTNLVDQFGVVTPLLGAVAAFVAAVGAIRWLLRYLQRHDLTIFAWYRLGAAALTILLLALGVA